MTSIPHIETRPSLSVLALISFVTSFLIARAFTTLSPGIVFMTGDLHIHHFWYGIAMLVVGGWLGISYNDVRVSRAAAVIFGAGGGLVGDEVGLLLTLGEYWTELTYTVVISFLTVASVLILVKQHYRTIQREFSEFVSSSASLYIGIFIATISIAFLIDTDNAIVITASSVSTAAACVIILSYFIQRMRRRK